MKVPPHFYIHKPNIYFPFVQKDTEDAETLKENEKEVGEKSKPVSLFNFTVSLQITHPHTCSQKYSHFLFHTFHHFLLLLSAWLPLIKPPCRHALVPSVTLRLFLGLCVYVRPCEVKSNMNQYERRERSAAILVPSRPTQEVHMQSNTAASFCDVWSLLEYSNFCSLCWCDFVEQEVKGTLLHDKVKPRSEDNNVWFAFLRFCFNCPEFYYIWGKLLEYRLDHLSGFKRIKMFKMHCFV